MMVAFQCEVEDDHSTIMQKVVERTFAVACALVILANASSEVLVLHGELGFTDW
jgi:hypothetical protein